MLNALRENLPQANPTSEQRLKDAARMRIKLSFLFS